MAYELIKTAVEGKYEVAYILDTQTGNVHKRRVIDEINGVSEALTYAPQISPQNSTMGTVPEPALPPVSTDAIVPKAFTQEDIAALPKNSKGRIQKPIPPGVKSVFGEPPVDM